ncbi:response regulator transcription factor [Novosphingobium cyanobacteriorum]|uniref:Helix-turn-helix transcriptional regulator n=1 Tax=Novosphingobium cyanobacteriorum TaxID=3024215 RepID=A0ABT6CMK6_9SPHN|nr:helix-turn-helix transcriptional regulator [Novosphingobium cyanobacteriorum]MDF8334759.1 helix-turn-helix transcriptional regulator [Novosphingobium cyanobacteriorum]
MLDERLDRSGEARLTQRQADCIARVAQGLSSKEIARELGISPSTVDNHIASAMHQFGFANRNAVARWYLEYRESMAAAETVQGDRPDQPQSNSKSYFRVRIPTIGGIRNSLSLKERLFAIVQVMIVSTMVASTLISFVLGLIFFLKLSKVAV